MLEFSVKVLPPKKNIKEIKLLFLSGPLPACGNLCSGRVTVIRLQLLVLGS